MKKKLVVITGLCLCLMLMVFAFYNSRKVMADETAVINLEWKNGYTDDSKIPRQDPGNGTFSAQTFRSSIAKTYNLTVYDADVTVTLATQTTNWSYSGSSSTLTGHNMMFQNIRGAYSIKSGGQTKITNADGTQQITDYFRVVDPNGNTTYWYYIEARCTVSGTVNVTTWQLSY